MTYQLTTGTSILRLTDFATIPKDERNRDYVAYLQWLEAGNTPLPAATPPAPIPSPDYQLLYDRIIGSTIYQIVRAAAETSQPLALAYFDFVAAMGDAKAGRPNVPALQACVFNILQLADLSKSQKALLRGYIQDANLASVFIIP